MNFARRWERNACDVKNERSSFQWGLQTQLFFCVYKEHFSPISSKPLSNRREIYEKSLVAYTDELKSHLRHTYRDKCGKPALSQVSETCPFVWTTHFSVVISETKLEYWATKKMYSLSKHVVNNLRQMKKDRLTEMCCNRRLFYIFVPMKTTKQTQYYDHTPQSV